MARAKKPEATPETETEAPKGQGRKVVLPNGDFRSDFIQKRYYEDGETRGDIMREINAMLEEEHGNKEQNIPYQIVFASTKLTAEARAAAAEEKAAKVEARRVAKEEKEAAKQAEKEAKAEAKAKAKSEKEEE